MSAEWPARLSRRGDKVLCGRPTGERGWCDGLIADVHRNLAGRVWLTLPRGEVLDVRSGTVVPSARAASRLAAGRAMTARTPWKRGERVLPLMAFEVRPPFRKRCPMCAIVAVVDSAMVGSMLRDPPKD